MAGLYFFILLEGWSLHFRIRQRFDNRDVTAHRSPTGRPVITTLSGSGCNRTIQQSTRVTSHVVSTVTQTAMANPQSCSNYDCTWYTPRHSRNHSTIRLIALLQIFVQRSASESIINRRNARRIPIHPQNPYKNTILGTGRSSSPYEGLSIHGTRPRGPTMERAHS